MKKRLDIIVANPSGNITIMVLTPTPREDYAYVAQKLLDMKSFKGEQVAFILPDKMEMCGLEFCGNASRAYALHTALSDNSKPGSVTVSVSGCEHPLTAWIESHENDSQTAQVIMEMPVPSDIRTLTASRLGINRDGLLVDMDGIFHLILEDVAPSAEIFEMLRHRIYEDISPDLPAFGVMFYDTVNQLMTPVVYVKDVDTTYFEGSCASGTVAASFALSQKLPDGVHRFTMQQPEGVLHTQVTKKEDLTEQITLQGLVTLSDIITVEID